MTGEAAHRPDYKEARGPSAAAAAPHSGHRPGLARLLGSLAPDGVLIYETFAIGNEALDGVTHPFDRTFDGAGLAVHIDVVEPTGPDTLAVFTMGGTEVIARLEPFAAAAGDRLRLAVKQDKVVVFDAATETRLD